MLVVRNHPVGPAKELIKGLLASAREIHEAARSGLTAHACRARSASPPTRAARARLPTRRPPRARLRSDADRHPLDGGSGALGGGLLKRWRPGGLALGFDGAMLRRRELKEERQHLGRARRARPNLPKTASPQPPGRTWLAPESPDHGWVRRAIKLPLGWSRRQIGASLDTMTLLAPVEFQRPRAEEHAGRCAVRTFDVNRFYPKTQLSCTS